LAHTQFAVFASGRGSNFQSIYQRIESGDIPGKIACVISNNRDAPVLEKARTSQIPAFHKAESQFDLPAGYVEDISALLKELQVDYVLLAGYMKMIPEALIEQYPNKIVNIHPALLPSFGGKGYYGMKVHQAVIERGVKWTGVTIHFVDKIYDHGPIIYQYPVRVRDDDTPESLSERMLEYEHRVYPKIVGWLCNDWVQVKGLRTSFTGPAGEWEL